MKNLTLRVSLFLGLLTAGVCTAFAQPSIALRVTVPFEFQVGGAVLPAGNYEVLQDGLSGVVTLQGLGNKGAAAVLSSQGGSSFAGKAPQLVFEQRNNRAVLTQIRVANQAVRTVTTGLR